MNAMHYVTVDKFELIGNDTVLLYIDLARHAHLRDPNVVQHAMDQYLLYPSVERWSAVAKDGLLIIEVMGNVDLDVAAEYLRSQNV